jgi:hypothetical protein
MYNYEAVAVYLWRHRWRDDDIWLMDEFENRLGQRATDLVFTLDSDDVPDREGYELLAERVVSIARRLQMTEVARIIPWHEIVSREDIKSRMNAIEAATGAH